MKHYLFLLLPLLGSGNRHLLLSECNMKHIIGGIAVYCAAVLPAVINLLDGHGQNIRAGDALCMFHFFWHYHLSALFLILVRHN
jgi:hypothetical protein